jgi:hypothetical protein
MRTKLSEPRQFSRLQLFLFWLVRADPDILATCPRIEYYQQISKASACPLTVETRSKRATNCSKHGMPRSLMCGHRLRSGWRLYRQGGCTRLYYGGHLRRSIA